jgi:transcription elongation factor Elf1
MEQNNNTKETQEETPETNEIFICPSCNKEQIKIITVTICEAKDSIWYKCSETKNCPLFKNKLNK